MFVMETSSLAYDLSLSCQTNEIASLPTMIHFDALYVPPRPLELYGD